MGVWGPFAMRDFANLRNDSWLQRRGAEMCLALGFSPAFAWLRPFGIDEQTFLARLGYWGGVLACWFLMMATVDAMLVDRRFFERLPPLARRAMVIAIAAFPMIIIVGAATNALSGWEPSFEEVTDMYFKIVTLGTVVALLAKAVLPWRTELPLAPSEAPGRELVPATPPLPIAPPVAVSPLAARLPLEVRGRLLCLEMEDHYVRVHTDRGSALVLMRLSDAINEAQPVQGRQVHRSWWVSDEAVEGFERNGRTGAVRLVNGARAPVSQRYLRSVEDSFA